jgi:hypothetical protein
MATRKFKVGDVLVYTQRAQRAHAVIEHTPCGVSFPTAHWPVLVVSTKETLLVTKVWYGSIGFGTNECANI